MKRIPYFFFFIISSIFVFVVFKDKTLIGGAESGLPFYNPEIMLDVSRSTWVNYFLGVRIPQAVSNYPLFFILNLLSKLLPTYLVQSLFFFINFFTALCGMYLLSRSFFSETSRKASTFAAVFYVVNLYAIANIWNRFLLNMMIFYSFLPLLIFIYYSGLKNRKNIYAVILAVLTSLLSYGFSSPNNSIILWFVLALLTIFLSRRKLDALYSIKYFFITAISWVIFNCWWIVHQVEFYFSSSFSSIAKTFFTSSGNLDTFTVLSNSLGSISNLLILKHGTYFSSGSHFPYSWPTVFDQFYFSLSAWIVLLYTLFVVIKKIKNEFVFFSFLLFLVGIFLSKGSSEPLGIINILIFKYIPFMEFFRNPFEKFGIIISLSFSLLLSISFDDFLRRVTSFKGYGKLLLLIPTTYIVLLIFPFINGLIFTNDKPPTSNPSIGYKTQVPEYYKDVSDWLNKQENESRLLTLPIGEEGIYYNWEKGYVGVELSTHIFHRQSISYSVGFPFYNQIANNIEEIFLKNNNFDQAASLLNIKYLLYRPDIDNKRSNLRDPEVILDRIEELEKLGVLNKIMDSGPLKLYEVSGKNELPKIYASRDALFTNDQTFKTVEVAFLENNNQIIYNPILNINNKDVSSIKSREIIHNFSYLEIGGPEYPKYIDDDRIFPYVSRIASSDLYKLTLIKEKIDLLFNKELKETLENKLTLLGKRLVEAKQAMQVQDIDSAIASLSLYENQLEEIFPELEKDIITKNNLSSIFTSHLFVFKELENSELLSQDRFKYIKQNFIDKISSIGLLPMFEPIATDKFPIISRLVYQFDISNSGYYVINVPISKDFPDEYLISNDLVPVQIDDSLYNLQFNISTNTVLIGEKIYFEQGKHMISFNQPKTTLNNINIDKIQLQSEADKDGVVSYEIDNFDPFIKYLVSFNYRINEGKAFPFTINLDTDITHKNDSTKIKSDYFDLLRNSEYFFDERNFSVLYTPKDYASKMSINFVAPALNKCKELWLEKELVCKSGQFKNDFYRKSDITITNFKATSQFSDKIFLISSNERQDNIDLPNVEYKKTNRNEYKINIKDYKEPFMLVFSEMFDSSWELVGNTNHHLVNGYANGWWIESDGEYTLRYKPDILFK